MVNCGLMIVMLMAVGLLFWVATRHWDHALKQLQSKYNELSRLEMTEREARASEHVARRREQLSRLQAEKTLQVNRRFLNCVSHEMRSYNIKRKLFADSILFKFAYGDKFMRKFVPIGSPLLEKTYIRDL